MLSALGSGLVAGVIAYLAALIVALTVRHMLHHERRARMYRWGVGVFAALVAIYTIITNLGRG